jgi:hypothetical protein
MNKDQRKVVVNRITELADAKIRKLAKERDDAVLALPTCTARVGDAVQKSKTLQADVIELFLAYLRNRLNYQAWGVNYPADDSRLGVLRDKAYKQYDADKAKICENYNTRIDACNARASELKLQVMLTDVPQALIDLLAAFQSEEF